MTEQEWTRLIQGMTATGGVNNPNAKENAADYSGRTGLDVSGRYQGYNAARFMLPGQFALDSGNLGLALEMQPQAHDALRQLLALLNNPTGMSQQYRDSVMAAVQQHLPELYSNLASSGMGIGAKQGLELAQLGQGASAGNAYDAELFSPRGIASRADAVMGIVKGAQPNYNNLEQLHGIEIGTPRNKTGLEIAGQLAGSYLGGQGGASAMTPSYGGGGGFTRSADSFGGNGPGESGVPGSTAGLGGGFDPLPGMNSQQPAHTNYVLRR